MGKLDEAMLCAQRGITLNPNVDMLLQVMARIYLQLGQPEECMASLDAADGLTRNSPWFPANIFNRSLAHLQAGRLECALQAADQAARLYAAPEVTIQQAICLAANDSWERAMSTVRRARTSRTELTRAVAEGLYRSLLGSSATTEKCLAVLRQLWDAVEHEGPTA
jgi:tetratricopeptide (TPR) repeat protein